MSLRLTEKQRLRIQKRHEASIQRFGYTHQALFWVSKEVQEVRFQQLVKILGDTKQSFSMLDFGCGFGDFYDYLVFHDFLPDYLGLDVSPEMIRSAKALHPSLEFINGELADMPFIAQQFDYVFLSGALNEVVDSDGSYAKAVIKELFNLSAKGMAFNLLNKKDDQIAQAVDLQSFYPDEIVSFCQEFARKVELIEDYLTSDFTILLRR